MFEQLLLLYPDKEENALNVDTHSKQNWQKPSFYYLDTYCACNQAKDCSLRYNTGGIKITAVL